MKVVRLVVLPLFILFLLNLQTVFSQTTQAEFSQENALRHLKKLSVEIGPRPMGSPAERRALEYAAAQFKELGCDTSYIMEMPYSSRANTTSGIAVGLKRGATGKMIVIGGHIDSAGPEIPGADDDGSGSATVIELARVICQAPTQSTYLFCCWGGEEQGLEGSEYFVNHFEALDSIQLMLQIDMANGDGLIDIDPDTHGASAPEWLTRAAIEEFYNLGYSHLRYPTHFFSINYGAKQGSGSDQEPFLQKGIPAVDLSTDASKPIHTPRDNFENFDPKGLKRSGDVMLRLARRFDKGVPSRTTEQYWLYLIGRTPIFVSFTWIWIYAGVTLLLAIAAFVGVRRRRLPPKSPDRIRWSGLKMIPLTIIVVACAWFSSNLVGLAKGVRFPWMVEIPTYAWLSAIGALVGIWIALRAGHALKLTKCPYVFAKRAMIILLLFTILLGLLNVKLLVEPVSALFLFSLALLFRNSFLKFCCIILAPVWMFRLVFSEWSALLFRTTAAALPGDLSASLIFNGIILANFTLLLIPFLYAIAAVIRDSRSLGMLIAPFRSFTFGGVLLAGFLAWGSHLYTIPYTDRYWYMNASIEESYDMNRFSKEIFVKGGEYLTGLNLHFGGKDTTLTDHETVARINSDVPFDTSWLVVSRRIENVMSGDTLIHNVMLTLSMTRRPYTVSITFSGSKAGASSLNSTWTSSFAQDVRTMRWYSYPDSLLRIPFTFTTTGSDTLKEKIEVTFDALASPMRAEREMTYVIPRTKYSQSYVYKESTN